MAEEEEGMSHGLGEEEEADADVLSVDELAPEQKAALDMAMRGESFFFTGAGGTGKV